jgi:predicted adenine nucleotide alpha hydrolase (AANH) superfamily ATPase
MNKSNDNLTHANKELQGNPTNITDTTQEYKKNNSQSRLGLLSKKLNLYLLVQYK